MTAETIGSAQVTIEADFNDFDETVQRRLVAAARRAGRAAEQELKRSGRTSGQSFGQELEKSARRIASKAGKDSGGLFSKGFREALSRNIGQGLFATLVAGLGAAVTAASPLSTVLGGAVAAVVALTAVLAQASGAAIALGGVFGSLVLAGAAVSVGFQGVGDAVKAQTAALAELNAEGKVSEATQKKLDAALKNLSPNAAATVRQLAAMAPAWQKVRLAVQDNLFQGVSSTLQQLGARYLPQLQSGLGAAAARINAVAVSLGKFLSAPAQVGTVSKILDGLNRILGDLLSTVQPLTGAFLNIFAASLPFAENLSTTLASLGKSFADFLNRAVADGSFREFMLGAFAAAQQLFGLLGNLGRIIGSVFSAGQAAGGSLLSTLNTLTAQLATFLASAEGQSALASFFGLIGAAGGVLVGVFSALQPLLSGLSVLFSSLQGPLRTLGTALIPVIIQLATILGNTFRQLAPVFAQLITAVTPLVVILGTTLSGVLRALLPVIVQMVQTFANLVPSLVPIIQLLGTGLVTAITALAPLFAQLLPVVLQLGQALLAGLVPVLQTLIPMMPQLVTAAVQLLSAFIQLLPSILPLIPPLAQISVALAQLLVQLAPLIVQIAQFATVMLGQMGPAITTVVGLIAGLLGGFLTIIQGLTRVTGAVVSFVSGFIARFTALRAAGASITASLVGAVIASFARLAVAVASAIGRMVAGVASGFGRMVSAAGSGISRFAGVVQDGINRAVGFIATLPGRAAAAISGLSSSLYAAGAAAVQGLVNGITSKAGAVAAAARDLASKVSGGIGGALKIFSPSRVTREQGQEAGEGLALGMRDKLRTVSRAAIGLANAAADGVKSAVGKLDTSLNGLGKNLSATIRDRLAVSIALTRAGIATVERSQALLDKKLKAAQSSLQDILQKARQLSQSVQQSILQTGNIAQGEQQTFGGIVNRLKSAVAQAKQFNSVILALTRAGLNKTGLQQIIDAGPEAGVAAGQAVLAAGRKGINQINQLQNQLQKAALQAANRATSAIFGQGLQIANGIVAGLRKQRASLDAQMLRLADVLVRRVLAVLRGVKLKSGGTLTIPGFADGGVISREGIYRGAEQNKPEAIVPLTKPRRAQQILDSTGLSALVNGKGNSSRTVEVPIHVAGNVVDYDALTVHIERVLSRYGFRPVLGLNTAGGML